MFRRRKMHDAKLFGSGVFYTYSFSLPLGTNIYKLADQLLSSGLATAASIAGSDGVRISKDSSRAVKLRKLFDDMIALHDNFADQSSLWTWVRTHPRAAFRLKRPLAKGLWKRDHSELAANLNSKVEALRTANDETDRSVLEYTQIIGGIGAIDRTLSRQSILAASPSSASI